MKKIQDFKTYSLNELNASTYDSVMKKVADRSDPRAFRLHKDATDLKYREFLNTSLRVKVVNDEQIYDFTIGEIKILNRGSGLTLELSNKKNTSPEWKMEDKKRMLSFDPADSTLMMIGSNVPAIRCFVDRRGANIISKILNLNEIESKPQNIPQF